ncbi:MAG: AAA-like domain-containing protein [Candidatus Poribacteria bacterium]|nr:AAA-like domain-containing protein [Candidatus Poribacteria bacterium]
MRRFGTHGRVRPEQHYIVSRSKEIADFISRIKDGKYIVLFAPRQTGKTTFFRLALEVLIEEDPTYFPIQLDFQTMRNADPPTFYDRLYQMICMQIESVFQKHGGVPSQALTQFLENTTLTDDFSMLLFFNQLASLLDSDAHTEVQAFKRVVLLIDEFDGIPQTVVSDFLYALRQIYLSDEMQCPYSVGIVGVKSIRQLDYDRSVSPFNIQDEFRLPNFTLEQVQELFEQYTTEVGQAFAPEVIEALHKQTAGQPFLVNRLAQILTEELDIPKKETLTPVHFAKAHTRLLREGNTNIDHLRTNVRRDRRFEKLLLQIASYESGVLFNPDDTLMNELVTYGVIAEGPDGMCQIVNPIYQHRILQIFKPTFNGLENVYFPEETGMHFIDYLTPTGQLEMESLLDNFQAFIARAGFRILQVPETPQEYVGQHLLYAYLDHFVRIVGADMFLEVQTGRGRIDLLIVRNQRKHIVETKIWEGIRYYQAGKKQLAAYIKLEAAVEGYYVVFDHRQHPEARVETEEVDGVKIRSYVIPVVQTPPSAVQPVKRA